MKRKATTKSFKPRPFDIDEWLEDNDPQRDRKMADRLSGREPDQRPRLGPTPKWLAENPWALPDPDTHSTDNQKE
jgi:hypothetical protein